MIESSELNVKRIIPNFNINLDIFKNEKYHKKNNGVEKYAVRSFIKHKNLEPSDQENLQSIKLKH